MHKSIMAFVEQNLKGADICGKRVLEVGSLFVNGSVRPYVQQYSPAMYIGIDIRGGQCVDIVMRGEHLYSVFARESFDIVLCLETLEHVELWRQVIDQMKYVLRPNGLILATTRSPGFHLHEYPTVFWRFTREDMSAIFADMFIECMEDDTEYPGILVRVRKPPIVNLNSIEIRGAV
jgi:SAM-dependent methyltransferase